MANSIKIKKAGKRRMHGRWLSLLMAWMILTVSCFAIPVETYAASDEISKRIEQTRKEFPNKSKFNTSITVLCEVHLDDTYLDESYIRFGGCDGLVCYVTTKVFHNPYFDGSPYYKRIGKTVKCSSTKQLKKLFKKAKKGDVIFLGDKNGLEFHVAIFLSRNSKGVRVYEGNAVSRNKVWYNRQWSWSKMKYDNKGAQYATIYRSENYSQVSKGKAAKNLTKGSTFTYDDITYRVTKAGIRNAKVKVISKGENAGDIPAAIGMNTDRADRLTKTWEKEHAAKEQEILSKAPDTFNYDEDSYDEERTDENSSDEDSYDAAYELYKLWYADDTAREYIEEERIVTYKKDNGKYNDEQYFTVVN